MNKYIALLLFSGLLALPTGVWASNSEQKPVCKVCAERVERGSGCSCVSQSCCPCDCGCAANNKVQKKKRG